MSIPNERTDAVESLIQANREAVAKLTDDEKDFLTNNSVGYRHLWHAFRADLQVKITELEADLRTASDQCEALSKDNAKLRELVCEWRDAFDSSNVRAISSSVRAIPDLQRLTRELGL